MATVSETSIKWLLVNNYPRSPLKLKENSHELYRTLLIEKKSEMLPPLYLGNKKK